LKKLFNRLIHKKHITLLLVYSGFHSLIMIFLSLWLVNQHFVYGDERILFQATAGIKKIILGMENKPAPEDYIFVNCCYDNMLTDKLDEEGFSFGNQPITDRKKLALFFDRLNKRTDSYKYLVCDIFFKDSSSFDSLLYSKLKDLKKFIVPYHLSESGTIDEPIFNVNRGLADYRLIQYVFMKYPLVSNDSLKSLPLRMYEDLSGNKFEKKGMFSYLGGKPVFSTIIIDFKLRYYELLDRNADRMYNLVNLGDLIRMTDSAFYKSVNNKIILIGDYYERDIHQTLFGKMSGTLILLNIYLSLLNQENIISFGLLFLLFIGYFAISFDLFSSDDLKDRKYGKKIAQTKFGKFLFKYLSFVLYLGIISVAAYFLFNIHLNILLLAFYLKAVDSLLKYIRNKKNNKEMPL